MLFQSHSFDFTVVTHLIYRSDSTVLLKSSQLDSGLLETAVELGEQC